MSWTEVSETGDKREDTDVVSQTASQGSQIPKGMS